MKTIKILGLLVAVILLFIGVGLFVLTQWINPNQFKSVLEKTIQENTGRTLTINGKLHWAFFPWLNIQIGQMTLSNPSNFSLTKPFLRVHQAHIRLKILPLLLGQVAFNKLILQNATLNLVIAPSGENNWQINEMPSTTVHASSSPETQKENKTSSSAIVWQRFSFHAIELQHGTIHWQNQQIDREITFSDVNLKARNMRFKQKFPIELSLIVHPYHLPYSYNLAIRSNCYIDLATQQYNLNQFALSGTMYSPNTSHFKQIPFHLKGDLDLNLTKGLLELKNFSGKLANADFSANVSGEKITKSPLLKGGIKISPFNLHELFQQLSMPLDVPAKASLRKIGANFSFQLSPKFFRMTNLNMVIDKTSMNGEINFTKFNTNTLQLDLTLSAINLDRYLPLSFQKKLIKSTLSSTQSSSSSKATQKEKIASINAGQFPGWLKNLDIEGDVNIEQLRYKKLLFNQLSVNFKEGANKIIDASLKAKFYQGDIFSQWTLDTTQSIFFVRESTKLSQIELNSLLRDLTGRAFASGRLQLTHQSSTQGNSFPEWIKNLNGNGSLTIGNGQIYGIDFPDLLQKGLEFLKQHADIVPNVNKSMPFSSITATYRIRKGVLYNNDLRLKSTQLNINGNGQLNFVKQQMNYRLDLMQSDKVTIPILLTGQLFSPTIRIDAAKLLQYTVQHELAKPLHELKKTPQKAGEWLKKKVFSGL